MELRNIAKQFKIDGDVYNVSAFGNGHINATYKVVMAKGGYDYILQSINTSIFTNVDELSDNILRISEHIKKKLRPVFSSEQILNRSITIIKTKGDKLHYIDEKGSVWRMFILIKNSVTVDKLKDAAYAYLAGAGFGDYQWMLSDLPAPPLYDVLPDFHNTPLRIDDLTKAISKDEFARLDDVRAEVDFLLSFSPEMSRVIELGNGGEIPQRIVHQDTKLSNILFDNRGEFLCVIDMDTTMIGYLCYDFGDAVRGGMNTGAEDEQDLAKISVNMELFKAFTKGYAATSGVFITDNEIDTLVFGAKLITYEQCVRFLSDYLNGDKYYRCSKPQHNLIRTRSQIALLKSIIHNYDAMLHIVNDSYNR